MKMIIRPVDLVNAFMSASFPGRDPLPPVPGVLVFDNDPSTARVAGGEIDLPLVEVVVSDHYPDVLETIGLSPLDTAVQYVAISVTRGE